MISRRLAALSLAVLALAGCHEDPTVLPVLVAGSASALTLITNGGTSSATGVTAGRGVKGGTITAVVQGGLNLGFSSTLTTSVALPVAPTTGNLPITAIATNIQQNGNVFISSTVTIDDVAPASVTIESIGGDVVVSGTLLTALVNGLTKKSITLQALTGTVFVTGAVLTSSADGTSSGDQAGDVTINAASVVMSGTIDTRGEANPAGIGGQGGAVSITSLTGNLYLLGSIATTGGTGTTTGGQGGAVTVQAGNRLFAFGPITSDGGSVNGPGATPTGGLAGAVALNGSGPMDVSATFSLRGGAATGTTQGAAGGQGGLFSCNGAVPARVYGWIDTRGGAAVSATDTVPSLSGGLGGNIRFGNTTPLASLELGRGTWSTLGGGGVDAVGDGGDLNFQNTDGAIDLGSILDTRGGSAIGTVSVTGGAGGNVTIVGTGSVSVQPLTAIYLASINAAGGAGSGANDGGAGGAVTLQCNGALTSPMLITTSGGGATGGTGGAAGAIGLTLVGGAAPSGDVILSGILTATGGLSTTAAGGAGGAVTVNAAAAANPGGIHSIATILTSGADGVGANAGGAPGNVAFSTQGGDISLAGTITGRGGSSGSTAANAVKNGATVQATCGAGGGSVISSATIDVSGGSSLDSTSAINAGAGGAVQFTTNGPDGSITLTSSSSITANGGTSSGSNVLAPGIAVGGGVALNTGNVFISVAGAISATGGSSSGITGQGAMGGVVGFITGGLGDITSTATISVNGGSATVAGTGGFINCTTASATPGIGLIAVSGIWTLNGAPGTAAGGIGGVATLLTRAHAITMSGAISAVGGSGAITGGIGGQVIANSNTNNDGIGGDITLVSGAAINVSGGSGATGGVARNAGSVPPGPAVIFDADSGLGASQDLGTEGLVLNSGTITAAGGTTAVRGGDITFDGHAFGVLTDPVPGAVDQTGTPAGTFTPD